MRVLNQKEADRAHFQLDLLRSYRTHKVVRRTFKLSFIILMVEGVFIYFERTRRTEQM